MLLWGDSDLKVRVLTDVGWFELQDAQCLVNPDTPPVYGWNHGALNPMFPLAGPDQSFRTPGAALDWLLQAFPGAKVATTEWGRHYNPWNSNKKMSTAALCRKADRTARKRLSEGDKTMLAYAKRML